MSKETHPGEAQTSVGTPDYMEKARELADSYPQLLARKQELKRQIDESHAWFYTRDEVIYKLSQGAHEQGERVKTSGTSNPVERTVLNCDKVLASMNREVQTQRTEQTLNFAVVHFHTEHLTDTGCTQCYGGNRRQKLLVDNFDDWAGFGVWAAWRPPHGEVLKS